MTDEQRIEEIGKAMCKEFRSKHCGNDCECANEFIAKKLVEQGYRKIPKGAVVLTREEYDALLLEQKRLNKVVKHFQELIEDGKLVSREEILQEVE